MYFDVVKKEMRPRRGKRKIIRHGPYSVEEKQAIEEWRKLLSAGRRMDGELAQHAYRDITLILVRIRVVMERYSFENTGSNVRGIDPHVILDELDFEIVQAPAEPDEDVYKHLQ